MCKHTNAPDADISRTGGVFLHGSGNRNPRRQSRRGWISVDTRRAAGAGKARAAPLRAGASAAGLFAGHDGRSDISCIITTVLSSISGDRYTVLSAGSSIKRIAASIIIRICNDKIRLFVRINLVKIVPCPITLLIYINTSHANSIHCSNTVYRHTNVHSTVSFCIKRNTICIQICTSIRGNLHCTNRCNGNN